jgi:dimethylhistidine N-methyltransferase
MPEFIDLKPDRASVRDAVLAGLSAQPKSLPPWLFYDAEGSRLFERICEQPEYYPTRTELSILERYRADIAHAVGAGATLVELGSGSHRKAAVMLSLLERPAGYVAIDVSGEPLRRSVEALWKEFPDLAMTAVCADFLEHADQIPFDRFGADGPPLGFFPGSTIGNMTPAEAEAFLAQWAGRLSGGGMLVGVDLVKDASVLDRAYNDAAGVTALFNRNMLAHVARRLDTDLDPARFRHHAFFNPVMGRIEMHLLADEAHQVRIEDHVIAFDAGESIHTENSYKYALDDFRALAERAGFSARQAWTDPDHWFAIVYLAAP